MKILLVEDDPHQASDISSELRRLAGEHLDIEVLTSEHDFLRRLSAGAPPDVLVLDVNLRWCTQRRGAIVPPPSEVNQAGPRSAGLRCLVAARNEDAWRKVPTILHTVRDGEKLRASGFKERVLDRYVRKSDDLAPVVHEILATGRRSAQGA